MEDDGWLFSVKASELIGVSYDTFLRIKKLGAFTSVRHQRVAGHDAWWREDLLKWIPHRAEWVREPIDGNLKVNGHGKVKRKRLTKRILKSLTKFVGSC